MPEPSDSTVADDAQLVRRAQAGELGALDELARRHHGEVARLLWRFARRTSDLDDLVQDVFVRVVRALPQWRAEQPFLHWVRRIAVNVGRDYCRRRSGRTCRRQRNQNMPRQASARRLHGADAPLSGRLGLR